MLKTLGFIGILCILFSQGQMLLSLCGFALLFASIGLHIFFEERKNKQQQSDNFLIEKISSPNSSYSPTQIKTLQTLLDKNTSIAQPSTIERKFLLGIAFILLALSLIFILAALFYVLNFALQTV